MGFLCRTWARLWVHLNCVVMQTKGKNLKKRKRSERDYTKKRPLKMGNPALIHPYPPSFLWIINIRMRREINDLLKVIQLIRIWVNWSHLIPRLNPTKVQVIFVDALVNYSWLLLDSIGIRGEKKKDRKKRKKHKSVCHSKVYIQTGLNPVCLVKTCPKRSRLEATGIPETPIVKSSMVPLSSLVFRSAALQKCLFHVKLCLWSFWPCREV